MRISPRQLVVVAALVGVMRAPQLADAQTCNGKIIDKGAIQYCREWDQITPLPIPVPPPPKPGYPVSPPPSPRGAEFGVDVGQGVSVKSVAPTAYDGKSRTKAPSNKVTSKVNDEKKPELFDKVGDGLAGFAKEKLAELGLDNLLEQAFSAPAESTAPKVVPEGQGAQAPKQDNPVHANRVASDPVNPYNGEFVVERVDLALPGKGLQFELRRTYRSRVSIDADLGFGWDHNYRQRLVPSTSPTCAGELIYVAGGGRSYSFERSGETTSAVAYKTPAGLRATLTGKKTDGQIVQWQLTSPDGSVATFDARGLLVSLVDATGYGLTLTWQATPAPVDWRVGEIRDAGAHVVRFEYQGNRLTRVVDQTTGVSASYAYNLQGELESATDAEGRKEAYEYENPTLPPVIFDYVPERHLQDACEVACAAGKDTCHALALCDGRQSELVQECWQRTAQEQVYGCSEACRAPDACGASVDAMPADVKLDCINGELPPGVDPTGPNAWKQGNGCDLQCMSMCDGLDTSVCNQLYTEVDNGWSPQIGCENLCANQCLQACADSKCYMCCTEGDCDFNSDGNDDEVSCSVEFGCEPSCGQTFLGGKPYPDCADSKPEVQGSCPNRLKGTCKNQCKPGCYQECHAGCVDGCIGDCQDAWEPVLLECFDVDWEATCRDECVDQCKHDARRVGLTDDAPDSAITLRYGRPDDLRHNLTKLKDGSGVVYLVNEYGKDLASPGFDAVIVQTMGERTMKFHYRDFEAERDGVAVKPTTGLLANYLDPLTTATWFDVCPRGCEDAPFWPTANEYVPWAGQLLVVPAGALKLTSWSGGVVPPTVLELSGTTKVIAKSAHGAEGLPSSWWFTLTNPQGTVTFQSVAGDPGTMTVSGPGLAGLKTTTISVFIDQQNVIRVYAGAIRGVVHVAQGACSAPFTVTRNASGQADLLPATACSSDLVVAPLVTVVDDAGYRDMYAKQGAKGFRSLDLLAATELVGGRHTAQLALVAGTAGHYDVRLFNDGTSPASLATARDTVVSKGAFFRTPATSARPLPIFHEPAGQRPAQAAVLYDTGVDFAPAAPDGSPGQRCDFVGSMKYLPFASDTASDGTVVEDPYGTLWSFYYDDSGDTIREVNHGTGALTSMTYDGDGQLTGVAHADGARTCVAYDGHGNVTDVLDVPATNAPGGAKPVRQRWEYTAAPVRLRRVFDPNDLGRALATYTYDAKGRLVNEVDALGQVTTYTPSDWGVPVKVERPDKTIVQYTLDETTGVPEGTIVDPAGKLPITTITDVDLAGRPQITTSPLGAVTTYDWDTTTPFRRLKSVSHEADGKTTTTVIGYDATGQVTSETNERTSTTIAYDAFGSPRKITLKALDGSAPDKVVCRRHSANGRLEEEVLPTGDRVKYEYDGEGRLIATKRGWFMPEPGATWDDDCPSSLPGAKDTFVSGEVARVTYDKRGRVIESIDARQIKTTVIYDGLGRPIIVKHPDGAQERTGYDQAGRTIWTAVYGAAVGNIPYKYPALADPGLLAATDFTYDAIGRPATVRRWHFDEYRAPIGDGYSTTTYEYDLQARRVTSYDDGGFPTSVMYDTAGRVLLEIAPTYAIKNYVYADGGRLVTTSTPTPGGSKSERTRLGEAGQVLATEVVIDGAFVPTGSWTYDQFGRLEKQVDAAGQLTEIGYDAFDRPRARGPVVRRRRRAAHDELRPRRAGPQAHRHAWRPALGVVHLRGCVARAEDPHRRARRALHVHLRRGRPPRRPPGRRGQPVDGQRQPALVQLRRPRPHDLRPEPGRVRQPHERRRQHLVPLGLPRLQAPRDQLGHRLTHAGQACLRRPRAAGAVDRRHAGAHPQLRRPRPRDRDQGRGPHGPGRQAHLRQPRWPDVTHLRQRPRRDLRVRPTGAPQASDREEGRDGRLRLAVAHAARRHAAPGHPVLRRAVADLVVHRRQRRAPDERGPRRGLERRVQPGHAEHVDRRRQRGHVVPDGRRSRQRRQGLGLGHGLPRLAGVPGRWPRQLDQPARRRAEPARQGRAERARPVHELRRPGGHLQCRRLAQVDRQRDLRLQPVRRGLGGHRRDRHAVVHLRRDRPAGPRDRLPRRDHGVALRRSAARAPEGHHHRSRLDDGEDAHLRRGHRPRPALRRARHQHQHLELLPPGPDQLRLPRHRRRRRHA
jgi:YD repeat-containing protein